MLPDGIDGQVAYYALAKSGLVRASLNVRDTAEDREFRLQHSGSRALISDRFRALAALAVPCVVIVAVIVSSSGISHRPGHGGNHPGLADATEGAKQGPRFGAGKEPGWSAPARAETNTTSCATVLLSTAVAIRCRKMGCAFGAEPMPRLRRGSGEERVYNEDHAGRAVRDPPAQELLLRLRDRLPGVHDPEPGCLRPRPPPPPARSSPRRR